jgi:hypothetical protein
VTIDLPIEIVGRFMREAPVDVEGLARELGLSVVREMLPDQVSGKIACDNGGACAVTINAGHPGTRQRFTLAHEIAHFILHRDLIGDGVVDNARYRSVGLSDYIERQANRYAADILMPSKLVIEKYRGGLRGAAQFAQEFGVSTAVAEIRLKELGHSL